MLQHLLGAVLHRGIGAWLWALLTLTLWLPAPTVLAQAPGLAPVQLHDASCPHRGELDEAYCDSDHNLVADTPRLTVDPKRLMIGITSVQDADAARRIYGPFVAYMGSCLKREVFLYPPAREPLVMEAMRQGDVHIGQFATGGTLFAVNFAGAVPFAAKGKMSVGKFDAYKLLLIVREGSPYRSPKDLLGKTIAHTSASSNSGNLAPRAFFPDIGLRPEVDYKVAFSGRHENSINGVLLGLYDAAAVASDVIERMIAKGEMKANSVRILYESDDFPPDEFAYAHNLNPKLVGQIKKCQFAYKWPEHMIKLLEGNDQYFPIDYRKDWQVIRLIAKASGQPPTKQSYQKLLASPH